MVLLFLRADKVIYFTFTELKKLTKIFDNHNVLVYYLFSTLIHSEVIHMNPLKGLLKKDFHISRLYFLIWTGFLMLALIAGIGLSAYTAQPAGTLPVLLLVSFAHIIFAPAFMLSLLNLEAKTQLWLYTPRRGIELILSKFGVIFCYQLILQLLISVYAAFNIFWFGREVYEPIGGQLFLQAALVLNIILLVAGLYFTTWITLLWTVFHSLKSLSRMIRWFIVIGIAVVYNSVEGFLLSIEPISDFIFRHKFEVISEAALIYENEQWSVLLDTNEVPVFPIFYYALLIIILLISAAKLLDRKVEV